MLSVLKEYSYVSIQKCKWTFRPKLEYRIKDVWNEATLSKQTKTPLSDPGAKYQQEKN